MVLAVAGRFGAARVVYLQAVGHGLTRAWLALRLLVEQNTAQRIYMWGWLALLGLGLKLQVLLWRVDRA